MKKIILALITLISIQSIGQSNADRSYIKERTNVQALQNQAATSAKRYAELFEKAKQEGIELVITNNQNQKCYLSGFDSDGNPVYDFDDNVNAAASSNIVTLQVGGSSGLDLDGSGIEIGHWEASGLALIDHQELNGKITHAESEPVTSHATHTAGTMLATGMDPLAKGMAPSTTIVSRRSNSDESEIANFGANGGILSNHSYSTGNPNGNIPLYGRYTNNAKEWDDIMYNAPYLTLCKSAGNTRNDGVNVGDGGYDIIYTVSTAKNILTIGAVNDVNNYTGPQSVSQSTFSSWGPTDDWRIKPDLVANGVTLYSSDNGSTTDYGTKSGTSMSTPTTTGAIALLQEHFHNLNGVYMKAASVKALLLGTTDEAGANDGPDFQNGFGLLNAGLAAEVISDQGILELSLVEGSTYTTTFDVDGTTPVTASIAWTDPSGNPFASGTDDQTIMLINDLDVRITQNSTVYEPWFMTPNATSDNFSDAAQKGDNIRDNVERIDINSLPAGNYTLTVSHKGNLFNGFQDFSLMLRGNLGTLGLTNLETSGAISVYPNPSTNDHFHIVIPKSNISDNYKVKIVDLQGRTIKNSVHFNKNFDVDVSEVNSGVYYIKIQTDEVDYVQMIKVEK